MGILPMSNNAERQTTPRTNSFGVRSRNRVVENDPKYPQNGMISPPINNLLDFL
jgi:hypothetical protein